MLPSMRWRSLATSHRLAALVGVGVLGLLLWRAGPAQVGAALIRLSIPALLLTLLLNVPITAARALRTRLVLDRLGHPVSWWSVVRAQLAGQTLSSLTPAASGDLVRAWLWRRDDDVPATAGVAAVVYERVGSLALLVASGAAFFAPSIGGPGVVAGICVAAAGVALVPWALTRIAAARRVGGALLVQAARLPGLRGRTRPLQRMGGGVAVLAGDTRLLGGFTATTLAVFVLSGLQVWLLVTGMGGAVGVAGAVGVYGLSQAGGSLSALPFGLGPSDAIVVGMLLRTGTGFGVGTTVALLLRATVTLPIALAATAAMAGRVRPSAETELEAVGAAALPVAAATVAPHAQREVAAYR
jgi:uncharacterized membrane protein YbhN (UPF0104 family)